MEKYTVCKPGLSLCSRWTSRFDCVQLKPLGFQKYIIQVNFLLLLSYWELCLTAQMFMVHLVYLCHNTYNIKSIIKTNLRLLYHFPVNPVCVFFGCFFHTQIQKWCVCTRFPQPSNIRAAWNLEFKQILDQLEKKWWPLFKICISTHFYRNFLRFFFFFVFLKWKCQPFHHIGLWNFDKVNIFKF